MNQFASSSNLTAPCFKVADAVSFIFLKLSQIFTHRNNHTIVI